MSADRPDDYDDLPSLRPLPPDPDGIPSLDDAERPAEWRKPDEGFGFWMAVVWSLLFFVATQIIIGFLCCGLPIIGTALMVDQAGNDGRPKNAEEMLKADPVLIGMMLTTMCAHLGGVAFAWLILRWRVGRQWKRKIALSRAPSLTHCFLVLVGLVAMLGVSVWVGALVEHVVPSLEQMLGWVGIEFKMKGASEMIPELVKASPIALALFTVGVLPAFDEELWCRGFIANGLSRRYQTWVVVLITSFLFGCMHVDPPQAVGAAFLGVAMHGAYIATRSLWAPMALHFFNNSLGVLHFYFKDRPLAVLQPLEDGMNQSPALFVLGSTILFAGVAYAFWQTRCRLASVDPDVPPWQPPGVSGIDLPPPGSGTIVTHDRLSPLSVVLVLAGAVAFGLVLFLA